MDIGILVAGEADEPDLAVALRAIERLDHAAAREVTIGVVVVGALVHLPQVKVVGLETLERFVELSHRHPGVAAMRADFRHQEHALAAAGDRAPHPDFALVLVVLPRVVEEGDPGVDRGVHEPNAVAHGLHLAEVIAPEPQRGDGLIGMPAERTQGYCHAPGKAKPLPGEWRMANGECQLTG